MSSIYLVFTYNICMTSFILLTLASSMAAASVKWDDIHFGRAIYYLIVVIIFKGNRKNLEHQSWNLTCVFIVQSPNYGGNVYENENLLSEIFLSNFALSPQLSPKWILYLVACQKALGSVFLLIYLKIKAMMTWS